MKTLAIAVAFLTAFGVDAAAQVSATRRPELVGASGARLARIDSLLLRAILVFTMTLASCQRSGAHVLSDADAQVISDTLRQITMAIQERTNGRDVDRQMSLWSVGPDATFVSDTLVFAGSESIRALLTTAYGSFGSMRFQWDTVRVAVLARDAGVVSARGHARYTTTNGQADSMTVAATYAFARQGGRWQLVHGHASHAPMDR